MGHLSLSKSSTGSAHVWERKVILVPRILLKIVARLAMSTTAHWNGFTIHRLRRRALRRMSLTVNRVSITADTERLVVVPRIFLSSFLHSRTREAGSGINLAKYNENEKRNRKPGTAPSRGRNGRGI